MSSLLRFSRVSRVPFRGMATSPIQSSKIVIDRTNSPKQKTPNKDLKFGRTFTDHMLEIDWTLANGWEAPHIKPYGDLTISPAASCLHYALQCFEGMKAYLDDQGRIRLFRPEMNMARMNRSAARLCMPTFDGDEFLKCIERLIVVDKSWIPQGKGFSLYIRPTYISTHAAVGVAAAEACKLFCILCPVGPYYPTGFKPVDLLADPSKVRAWPGGTGNAKVGGNYALSILPGQEAIQKGYSQILWVFGPELDVTEVGTMNQFFYMVDKKSGTPTLVTAPLDGTILPGVTRDSILQLARAWGINTQERRYTLHEVIEAVNEGRMLEAFGAGTAAVVCPVKSIHYLDQDIKIPLDKTDATKQSGPLTQKLLSTLEDIQYGKVKHEWSRIVAE